MLIRTAIPEDAAQIAKVDVDTWRATYQGILPATFLDNLSYQKRQNLWRQILTSPTHNKFQLMIVLEDYFSGTIVGFASGGEERTGQQLYRGEIYTLYILPAHQRNRLGRRLVQTMAKRLADAGMNSLLIRVLEKNPAKAFYEKMGGQRIFSLQSSVGGCRLQEIAYGWKQIRVLY